MQNLYIKLDLSERGPPTLQVIQFQSFTRSQKIKKMNPIQSCKPSYER